MKASNAAAEQGFGFSLMLSADGSTLAVGAIGESSAATGINGNQVDHSTPDAGAGYLLTRSTDGQTARTYLKAFNTGQNDVFGYSVALSADGNTLAVGAMGTDSAGAVYLFTRTGTTWVQQAYLKASNAEAQDFFGRSIALSADGNTLAVGAIGESSAATGVDGNQADDSADSAGAVYLFTRTGTTWMQQAYAKASNAGCSDGFGHSVALSADGNTLAVGAIGESSVVGGVSNTGTNPSAPGAGAVYIFGRNGVMWTQQPM